MTHKDIFKDSFHKINKLEDPIINRFVYSLTNLFQRMDLHSPRERYKVCVSRYLNKNGIQDLEKLNTIVISEIKKLKDKK